MALFKENERVISFCSTGLRRAASLWMRLPKIGDESDPGLISSGRALDIARYDRLLDNGRVVIHADAMITGDVADKRWMMVMTIYMIQMTLSTMSRMIRPG